MRNLFEARDLAVKLSRQVGYKLKQALELRQELVVSNKAGSELVTDLDIWAEKVLVEEIKRSYPFDQILAEENTLGLAVSEQEALRSYTWVIDPIDGTTNFISGLPHVAVSIAMLAEGVRTVAVVHDVAGELTYSAIKAEGAWVDSTALRVSSNKDFSKTIIATGCQAKRLKKYPELKSAYDKFFSQARDVRILGSAALEQCWVASGKLDAYFEMGLRPWDVAAGSLIVEEAGGLSLNPLEPENKEFSSFSSSFLFCANSEISSEIRGYLG